MSAPTGSATSSSPIDNLARSNYRTRGPHHDPLRLPHLAVRRRSDHGHRPGSRACPWRARQTKAFADMSGRSPRRQDYVEDMSATAPIRRASSIHRWRAGPALPRRHDRHQLPGSGMAGAPRNTDGPGAGCSSIAARSARPRPPARWPPIKPIRCPSSSHVAARSGDSKQLTAPLRA